MTTASATASPTTAAASPAPSARWWTDVRSGQLGSLPIIIGLIIIAIVFQSQNDHFLTASNFVNLIVQSAAFATIAMGIVFVLLLGEIDLSVGYVSGVGGRDRRGAADPGRQRGAGRRSRSPGARRGHRDRHVPRPAHHQDRDPVVRGHARRADRLERRRAAVDRQPRHGRAPEQLPDRPGQRLPARLDLVAALGARGADLRGHPAQRGARAPQGGPRASTRSA